MRDYFSPIRKAIMRRSKENTWCQGYEEKRALERSWWETIYSFLHKVKLVLPGFPLITPPGIDKS